MKLLNVDIERTITTGKYEKVVIGISGIPDKNESIFDCILTIDSEIMRYKEVEIDQ
jgi:hypothetical protein